MAMAKAPPPAQPKQFVTRDEIDRAIAKLGRRLAEINELDPRSTRYDDPRIENIEHNVRDSILEIFGPESPEYRRHQLFEIVLSSWDFGEVSDHERQRRLIDGLPRAIADLQALIKKLEEKRSDFTGDVSTRVRGAFADLDLHPRIADVSADLFRDGHYRNAVLDACVALVNFVKEKSRRHDLDGAALMRTVFSKNNPVLAFNELKDPTDLDEQEGLMHLFEGAVMALRNPRAHALAPDTAEGALEFIAFLSLLAKQLESARRQPAKTP